MAQARNPFERTTGPFTDPDKDRRKRRKMKPVEGKVKAKATGPAQVITPDQKLKEEMKKKGLLAPVPQSKKKKGKKKTPRKKRK